MTQNRKHEPIRPRGFDDIPDHALKIEGPKGLGVDVRSSVNGIAQVALIAAVGCVGVAGMWSGKPLGQVLGALLAAAMIWLIYTFRSRPTHGSPQITDDEEEAQPRAG